jgi:transposase, IS5 family
LGPYGRRSLRGRAAARGAARQGQHGERGLGRHAYRSKANEEFLEKNGFVSRIHRKKPPGRPMPETTRRANALKSKVHSRVEHVFAAPKDKMDLFIRTIGIARARVKIGMANLVYNMKRLAFLDRLAAA